MNTCSQGLKFAVFASSCALRARCTLAMCSPSSGRRSTSSLARCWRQQCIYPISVLQGLKLDTAAFKVLSRSAEVAERHGLLKVDVVYNRPDSPIVTRDPSSSSPCLSPFVTCLNPNLAGSSLPARPMRTPGTFFNCDDSFAAHRSPVDPSSARNYGTTSQCASKTGENPVVHACSPHADTRPSIMS